MARYAQATAPSRNPPLAGSDVARDEPDRWNASQGALIWRRFRKRKLGVAGLILLALVILSVIIIPIVMPYRDVPTFDATKWATMGSVDPITGQVYLLGTDFMGRDEFPRLFVAGRMSLSVALMATIGIVILGSLVGAIAGFYGGWVDSVLMRVTDFLSVLPLLPAYLIVIRLLGWASGPPVSATDPGKNILFTLGAIALVFTMFGWMPLSRLVRTSVLTLRGQDFVESARALGASSARILFKHALPNCIAPVLVAATFALGDFIIIEALLTYFGVGLLDPPTPSWGNMLSGTQNFVWLVQSVNPFEDIHATLILAPSLMILITVLSLNYVADALRDALDPRST